MKTINVAHATPAQLNYLVAKIEGEDYFTEVEYDGIGGHHEPFEPATSLADGGAIIECEDISIIKLEYVYGVDSKGYTTRKRIPVFGAVIGEYFDTEQQRDSYGDSYGEIYYMRTELVVKGSTPLIAAMRCFCISKLGHTAEVPEELI